MLNDDEFVKNSLLTKQEDIKNSLAQSLEALFGGTNNESENEVKERRLSNLELFLLEPSCKCQDKEHYVKTLVSTFPKDAGWKR